jgi:hypothetical protein
MGKRIKRNLLSINAAEGTREKMPAGTGKKPGLTDLSPGFFGYARA